jgi:hypothetical protein
VLTRLGKASINRHAENILTHSCYATAGQCTSVEGSNPSKKKILFSSAGVFAFTLLFLFLFFFFVSFVRAVVYVFFLVCGRGIGRICGDGGVW